MSGPQPIGNFRGCNHRWGTAKLDDQIVRTIEYDMTDFVKSCIEFYSNLIDGIAPGSSELVQPSNLPTDSSGGGNALAFKFGDRWELFPAHKAWRRFQ